jgi:hypothetical protein
MCTPTKLPDNWSRNPHNWECMQRGDRLPFCRKDRVRNDVVRTSGPHSKLAILIGPVRSKAVFIALVRN